jgi:predicted DNA-binding transcriptional regulator AlpA
MSVPEVLALPPAVEFVDAARAFALSRSVAYELARAGTFPVPLLTYGPNTRRARRADILAALGVEDTLLRDAG